ncbi:hypothetical protein [Streptomyces sp. NPDC001089]
MAIDVRVLVREAEEAAAPFVARPVDMQRCPVHGVPYELNWARLLVCPRPSHQPPRGDDD